MGSFHTLWWIDVRPPRCYLYNGGHPFDNRHAAPAALDRLIPSWFVNRHTWGTIPGAFPTSVLQQVNTSDCSSAEAFWKAARWVLREPVSTKLWINKLTLCAIYPSLSSPFSLSLCLIQGFQRQKNQNSAPKGGSEGQRGFQNASGAASVGNIALDYAGDAPALDLISFNICLRVLTAQSCAIISHFTPGSLVSPLRRATVPAINKSSCQMQKENLRTV